MILECARRTLTFDSPKLMGVVNTSPDSFSDLGGHGSSDDALAHALSLADAGAAILDVGGQSAITGVPEIDVGEEVERVVPLVARLRAATDCLISVDTYRAQVAGEAIAAGADIVNDVSGGIDPELATLVAASGAAYVLMHTRFAPKHKSDASQLYAAVQGGVVADVVGVLRDRSEALVAAGVRPEQLIVDPGPDFAKTPAQTVAVLRAIDQIVALRRPVLLALSRKDFIGALTGTRPRERDAGTIAAILALVPLAPASLVRVHDVRAARDALIVYETLRGGRPVDPDLRLAEGLRWQNRR